MITNLKVRLTAPNSEEYQDCWKDFGLFSVLWYYENSATLLTDVCIASLSDWNAAEFQSVSVSERHRESYSDTTKPNTDTQSMAA